MTGSPELAGRACEDAWVWGQEGSGQRFGHGRDGVGIRAPGLCAPRDAGCSLLLKQFASPGAGPERPHGLPRCSHGAWSRSRLWFMDFSGRIIYFSMKCQFLKYLRKGKNSTARFPWKFFSVPYVVQ